MNKPITPRLHGLIDYGFAASNLLIPRMLRMSPRARRLFTAFGAMQGTLNAATVQPVAAAQMVPFRLHGKIEKNSGLLYLLAPILLGIAKEPKARTWWIIAGVALVTVFNLTDWTARNTDR